MARQRGREVITAVAAILPDALLLSLYGQSQRLAYLRDGKTLPDVAYSLLPAFYDGLLEAMPASAQLIDGYEFAYACKERRQFLKGYERIHQQALKLSAVPEKYKAHVKAGFGLWVDYRNKLDYFTPEEFQRAVSAALEVSDGYVWIYSHGPRFFPAVGDRRGLSGGHGGGASGGEAVTRQLRDLCGTAFSNGLVCLIHLAAPSL
jgi:hypothetical protein